MARRLLRREIGSLGAFALGYSDIASTVYFLLGVIALYAGPALPLVIMISAVPFLLLIAVYMELVGAFPESGGAYLFVRHSMGEKVAFMAGWLLMLDQVIMISYGALGVAGYISFLAPFLSQYIPYIAISIVVGAMILNLYGIKESAHVSLIITVVDLAILYAIIVLGLLMTPHVAVNVERLGSGIDVAGLLVGLSFAMRGYVGIDVVAQSAGETYIPGRDLPKAIAAIGILLALNTSLISMVAFYTVPIEEIGENLRSPMAYIASGVVGGQVLAPLVTLDALIILSAAVIAGIVGFSRMIYRLSLEGLLPARLGAVNRRGTPYLAVLVAGGLAAALALPGEVELVAMIYGLSSLVNYVLTAVAYTRYKKTPLQSTVSFPPIIGYAAVAALGTAVLLIGAIRPYALVLSLVWAAVGFAVMRLTSLRGTRRYASGPQLP